MWIVKVQEGGALVWVAKRLSSDTWACDFDAAALEWYHCFDYESIQLLPTSPIPPLQAHLLGSAWYRHGPAFVVDKSGALPLLDWQLPKGFAQVPEKCLKLLMEQHGLMDINYADLECNAVDDYMSMLLLRRLKPAMSHNDDLQAVLQRRSSDTAEAKTYVDEVTLDTIMDVAIAGDQKDLVKLVTERKAEHQKARAVAQKTLAMIAKRWPEAEKAMKQAEASHSWFPPSINV